MESEQLTVPTELDRTDVWWDIMLAAVLGIFIGIATNYGVPWPLLTPFVVAVAVQTMSSEVAGDVRYLGAFAAPLRSRLGLRRAHEWIGAWWHYFWEGSGRAARLEQRTDGWRVAAARTRVGGLLAQRVPLAPAPRAPVRRPTAVLEIWPTTNASVASPRERSDQLQSLATRLMGLSHELQLICQAREIEDPECEQWPLPPKLARRWLTVIDAEDTGQLAWRVKTLKASLEGVGLRCAETTAAVDVPTQVLRDGVKIGDDEYAASVVLRRWPREVAPGWLGQVLAEDLPVDVAIHVQPQDARRVSRWLKHQQEWQTEEGTKDAGNELGARDARETRRKLIARTDRPVKVAVVLTVRARDPYQLSRRVDTLQHLVGLALGDVRLAKYEQDRGLQATQPTGVCEVLGAWRTLDCASVASTGIFQPATVDHQRGARIGTTHEGSMLVRLDPFDPSLESFGGIVLAKVGMGKSFFLKLLARRLEGVEVLIVEQRTPAEYDGIAGARSFNLADVPYGQRADRLRTYVSDLWEAAKADPHPRLLVLDELWSLLRDPALAALIEEIARIGRHHYLALWIASQQVQELLDSGKAVLDNAAVKVFLKQHDNDLDKLCDAVGLPVPARRFLRTAARGQALLDCGGLLVPVDIQANPDEHVLISTDPREKVRHAVVGAAGAAGVVNGHSVGEEASDGTVRAGARVAVAAARK